MASDFYSNLYQTPPNVASGTAPVYKGPMGERRGEVWAVYGTVANTVANPIGGGGADTVHLCEVPEGTKLISFTCIASADLDTNNDFTFNLGFTGALTGFLSASTGLQATSAVAPADSALISVAAAADGSKSELLLTRQAGSLEAAGTIYFLATFLLP